MIFDPLDCKKDALMGLFPDMTVSREWCACGPNLDKNGNTYASQKFLRSWELDWCCNADFTVHFTHQKIANLISKLIVYKLMNLQFYCINTSYLRDNMLV